jgi:hypothetical protein
MITRKEIEQLRPTDVFDFLSAGASWRVTDQRKTSARYGTSEQVSNSLNPMPGVTLSDEKYETSNGVQDVGRVLGIEVMAKFKSLKTETTMSNKRKPCAARRIHLWVAIILAFPMAIMAVSGILIAMRSVTQIQVPKHWLGGESVPERLPITAYLELPGGESEMWWRREMQKAQQQSAQASPLIATEGA